MARVQLSFVFIVAITALATTQHEISAHSMRLLKRVAFQEDRKHKDAIVFEGPSSRKFNPPSVPEECKKQGFCEEIPDYPNEDVQRIIDALGHTKQFQMDTFDNDVEIVQRLGGTGENYETELCEFTPKIIYPQLMPDAAGKWFTVINIKERPVQGFKVELCNTNSSSCSSLISIGKGYSGGCKQKYDTRMVDILDDNGNHVTKPLKLPSCCSCVLTKESMFRRH